jgi:hypothetical protein
MKSVNLWTKAKQMVCMSLRIKLLPDGCDTDLCGQGKSHFACQTQLWSLLVNMSVLQVETFQLRCRDWWQTGQNGNQLEGTSLLLKCCENFRSLRRTLRSSADNYTLPGFHREVRNKTTNYRPHEKPLCSKLCLKRRHFHTGVCSMDLGILCRE